MTQSSNDASPAWGTNTKLVVALTSVVIIGALLVNFQFILSPLLIALVLSYLLHPVAVFFKNKLRLSWDVAVALIYFLLVILLLGLLALGGVGVIQQVQSVINLAQESLAALPQLIQDFSEKPYLLGPFIIDLTAVDVNALSKQALDMVQPLLSQTGALLGSVAGGAANFFGWTMFVIFVSYFVVAESNGVSEKIITVEIPGYAHDVARLTRELSRVWNAFLRGQIIIFFLTVVIYIVVLGALGVHYAISLALLAGLARFLPYVGPIINWVILALVAYFQDGQLFGMTPFYYTLLVIAITVVLDMVIDYMITPRIFSDTLQVHPAAVLVAAIIAATLFGLLGVVIAAPILATAALFWKYAMRKMLDLDPWPEAEHRHPQPLFLDSVRRFFLYRKPNQRPIVVSPPQPIEPTALVEKTPTKKKTTPKRSKGESHE